MKLKLKNLDEMGVALYDLKKAIKLLDEDTL